MSYIFGLVGYQIALIEQKPEPAIDKENDC